MERGCGSKSTCLMTSLPIRDIQVGRGRTPKMVVSRLLRPGQCWNPLPRGEIARGTRDADDRDRDHLGRDSNDSILTPTSPSRPWRPALTKGTAIVPDRPTP